MEILVGLVLYGLLFVVILLTLYWVIRKAVAGGIRDAQIDEMTRRS